MPDSANFICAIPGCNKTFTRHDNMVKHLRSVDHTDLILKVPVPPSQLRSDAQPIAMRLHTGDQMEDDADHTRIDEIISERRGLLEVSHAKKRRMKEPVPIKAESPSERELFPESMHSPKRAPSPPTGLTKPVRSRLTYPPFLVKQEPGDARTDDARAEDLAKEVTQYKRNMAALEVETECLRRENDFLRTTLQKYLETYFNGKMLQ